MTEWTEKTMLLFTCDSWALHAVLVCFAYTLQLAKHAFLNLGLALVVVI